MTSFERNDPTGYARWKERKDHQQKANAERREQRRRERITHRKAHPFVQNKKVVQVKRDWVLCNLHLLSEEDAPIGRGSAWVVHGIHPFGRWGMSCTSQVQTMCKQGMLEKVHRCWPRTGKDGKPILTTLGIAHLLAMDIVWC